MAHAAAFVGVSQLESYLAAILTFIVMKSTDGKRPARVERLMSLGVRPQPLLAAQPRRSADA